MLAPNLSIRMPLRSGQAACTIKIFILFFFLEDGDIDKQHTFEAIFPLPA